MLSVSSSMETCSFSGDWSLPDIVDMNHEHDDSNTVFYLLLEDTGHRATYSCTKSTTFSSSSTGCPRFT